LQWHYSPEAMTLPIVTQVTINFKLNGPEAVEPAAFTGFPPDGKPVTVKSISVDGLTGSARDELLRRLPVHEGDTLDAEGAHALIAALHAFDEHLGAKLAVGGEGAASLNIFLKPAAVPGAPRTPPNVIRVGGNVQQAKLLAQVRPVYPPEAKAQGIQGLVQLQAVIGKDGKVERLEVLSGDPILAAAAIEAVRQWQYQTTLLNGEPVEVMTQIDVNFTLSK